MLVTIGTQYNKIFGRIVAPFCFFNYVVNLKTFLSTYSATMPSFNELS